MGVLLNYPKFQAFDDKNVALVGGKLHTYIAGTTTNKATYSDYNLATANANPVVLDRRGEAVVYGAGAYKFVLKDSANNTIWTMDNVQLVSGETGGYVFYPDSAEADQGAVSTGGSIKDIITAIGAAKNATIVLTHTGAANTTTYTVGTNLTVTANIKLKVECGAIMSTSAGITTTINGPFDAGLYQVFSGTGTVAFGSGSVSSVYPEWWAQNTTPGTTDMTSALQAAITAGNEIVLTSDYMHSTTLTVTGNKKICGLGQGITYLRSWGCNGFTITGSNVEIADISMFSYTAAGVFKPYTKDGIVAIAAGYPASIYYKESIHHVELQGWANAIHFDTIWESSVDFVNVTWSTAGVYLTEFCANVSITKSSFNMNSGQVPSASIYLTYVTTYAPEGIKIIGNALVGGQYGVYAPSLGNGIVITGNETDSSVSAIHALINDSWVIDGNYDLRSSGATPTINIPNRAALVDVRSVISNNKIINSGGGYGISVGELNQGITITDNEIVAGGNVALLAASTRNINFSHNIAIIGTVIPIVSATMPLVTVSGTGHIISDNINMRSSVHATDGVDILVFNNTFDQKVTMGTVAPIAGTWNLGDRIYKKYSAAGSVMTAAFTGDFEGWTCTVAGTFSTATDNTGDTDGSTGVITGMTDTSDFNIGDYVTVSAGFASASIPYLMIAKTATSITLAIDSTAAQNNVTVATPDPTFATFGQQGYRSGAVSPAGAVTPYFIGEEYLDSTAGKWYKSIGLAAANWVALN